MNAQALQDWQTLNLKRAQGTPLTPDEQAFYDAGCAEFDAEEEKAFAPAFQAMDADIRQKRESIRLLMQEKRALRAQLDALDTRIEALEAALDERIERTLGAGS